MKARILIMYILCIFILTLNVQFIRAEEITESYTGIDNAEELLNNINFTDVASMPNNYWAKDSIYKMAGLSIIQGYGEKEYRPLNNITKAEAIALIYKALGKEEDAKKEAQNIQEQMGLETRNVKNLWALGYLSLAQKDGLITEEEFEQAINPEAYKYYVGRVFNTNAAVQRQEAAEWIAKAFKIEPIYNQVLIFNYKDWKAIDYEKIPYIEAILQNKIMNGDSGYFYPTNILRRDEMAQILSNIEDRIYKINNLNKKYGVVESIVIQSDKQLSKETVTKTILIRTDDGTLNSIILTTEKSRFDYKNQEIGAHKRLISEKEVVVNKNGVLGNSSLLNENDQILFIYDKDKKIRYVEAKTNLDKEKIVYGIVENIYENKISFSDENGNSQTFVVSKGAVISIDNEGKSLKDISLGDRAYFTVKNNIITRIEKFSINEDIRFSDDSKSDVRGIVQEINPNLNYISIYSSEGKKNSDYITTYHFPPKVEVKKDGQAASIKEIEVGDTVYIKLDGSGKVELINAQSNYYWAYGKVLFIGKNFLTVKYDDDTIQQLQFDDNVLVYKEGRKATKEEILEGDMVKLLLNQSGNYTKIKTISIEGDYNYIVNIYKGKVYSISKDNIILYDVQLLKKDKWIYNFTRGFKNIKLDDRVKIFNYNEPIDFEKANEVLLNKYVYLATYKDYHENEKAIKISYIDGYEKIYNDEVLSHSKSSKNLELLKTFDEIHYTEGTIITRYGRLISGSSIEANDPVYAVGLRNPAKEIITAGVIQIVDKPSILGIDIYRGRILSIDESNSFTVESFSKLKGTKWEYANTPKTFGITGDTTILSSSGIINNRDFKDYANNSYKDKIVYIAAKGDVAQIVSDAPYGVINLRGEIYNINLSNNAVLSLKESVVLDINTNEWNYLGDSTVNILQNSIIVKNGDLVGVNDLEIGDKIRVIKKDTASQDGFIIFVEG